MFTPRVIKGLDADVILKKIRGLEDIHCKIYVTDPQEPRIRIQLKIYELVFGNLNLHQINSNIPCDVIHLHLLILATL
jgi:hypothetical protein